MTPDVPVTLAVALLGTLWALLMPRRWALLGLSVPIIAHPCVLLLPPPQLALTATRFIAVCLIARCLYSKEIREQFRWRICDTAVLFYYACITCAMLMASKNFGVALNNRVGFFLSAILPFFCARFLLTDRLAFYNWIQGMLWAALPLGLLGVVEMFTAYNPWDSIRLYGFMKVPRMSDGFREFMGVMRARARGPFVQYIMFGWAFAVLVAFGTTLYFKKKRLGLWVVPWLGLPAGIISSIASGPMTLAVFSVLMVCLFPLRKYWKAGLTTVAVIYFAAIGYSNRSPMQIVGSMGFNNHSSWYRYELVRHVTETKAMSGHWFAGYGEIPPTWGKYHDLCIHWVWMLAFHGLAGVVGFYTLIGTLFWGLWQAKAKAETLEEQWVLWSMMSTLVAALGAMLVVALFSEMYYFWHLIMGVLACAPNMVGGNNPLKNAARQVGVIASVGGRKVMLRYTLQPGQALALVRQDEGGGTVAEPLKERQGTVEVDR